MSRRCTPPVELRARCLAWCTCTVARRNSPHAPCSGTEQLPAPSSWRHAACGHSLLRGGSQALERARWHIVGVCVAPVPTSSITASSVADSGRSAARGLASAHGVSRVPCDAVRRAVCSNDRGPPPSEATLGHLRDRGRLRTRHAASDPPRWPHAQPPIGFEPMRSCGGCLNSCRCGRGAMFGGTGSRSASQHAHAHMVDESLAAQSPCTGMTPHSSREAQ